MEKALRRSSSYRVCEDCGVKDSSMGLAGQGNTRRRDGAAIKQRWCVGCAKGHAGAVSIHKSCEGCGLKPPSYGLPSAQGKGKFKRWCG